MGSRGKSSHNFLMILGLLAIGLVVLPACGGGGAEPVSGTSGSSGGTSGGSSGGSAAPAGGDPYANIDKAKAATITGTVKFTGTAPEMAAIQLNADQVCADEHEGEDVREENHIQDESGGLKNVLVYLEHDFAGIDFPTPAGVLLDQKGCNYEPHVWGMMVGQTITIKNSDPTLHNINCQPKKNKPFNKGMPTRGMKFDKSFSKAEVPVYFKCDVHPWMNAYAGVFTHPFFTVTAADGSFTIEHAPAGTYKVKAWHEKWGFVEGSATVEASGAATVDFSYDGTEDLSVHKTVYGGK